MKGEGELLERTGLLQGKGEPPFFPLTDVYRSHVWYREVPRSGYPAVSNANKQNPANLWRREKRGPQMGKCAASAGIEQETFGSHGWELSRVSR